MLFSTLHCKNYEYLITNLQIYNPSNDRFPLSKLLIYTAGRLKSDRNGFTKMRVSALIIVRLL